MPGGNTAVDFKKEVELVSYPVAASTELFRGAMIAIDTTTGYAVLAADHAAHKFVGIANEHVNNTGAAGAVSIQVRRRGAAVLIKNTTAAVTDVGQRVYVHTPHSGNTQGLVGLAAATTNGILVGTVVKRLPDRNDDTSYSEKRLLVDLQVVSQENSNALIGSIEQTINFDDFTDNADATGYVDITDEIPAHSLVLGWSLEVTEAFDGGSVSTATAQVGVAGDLDELSATTTHDVNTTGTVSDNGPGSGDDNHRTTATTVRVTITEDNDFGHITAGSAIFRLRYLRLA